MVLAALAFVSRALFPVLSIPCLSGSVDEVSLISLAGCVLLQVLLSLAPPCHRPGSPSLSSLALLSVFGVEIHILIVVEPPLPSSL